MSGFVMVDLLEIAKAVAAKPKQTKADEKIFKPILPSDTPFCDYTKEDLEDIDRLLSELAKMEAWSQDELADRLYQRERRAPVNVIPVLREIREAYKAALAVWPNQPAPRSNIRICKLDHVRLVLIHGGRTDEVLA